MLKKLFSIIPLLICCNTIYCQQVYDENASKVMKSAQKYNQVIYFLERMYLDTVDVEKSTEDAIKSVLEGLDPHSSYISKEEMKKINESFDGNFTGIGVEFNILNDTLIVVNTLSGGPARKLGMLAGDRITKVDGKSVIGITKEGVPKLLRGEKGTIIKLTIERAGSKTPLEFVIERDNIPLNSLDASYKITPEIGYIKLNRFMATTVKEFTDAMKGMPDIKGLILDLRGNGGGFLDQAISLTDNFLKDGSLIVYTEGRSVPKSDAIANIPGIFEEGKLVVLVDEESASASEIVAGAIQDWDRGTIIGRSTFGKGLVQRQIPLIDSSAIRMTIARYHTPSGRVIQRPYDKGDAKGYYQNYMKRYSSGELTRPDSLEKHIPDSLKYKTLVKGRTVYGGGGINPDIFIPMDSSFISKYWGQIIAKSIISDYVVNYVDKNRKTINKDFDTFDKFNKSFNVTDNMINEIVTIAEGKNIKRDDKEIKRINETIKRQIKALIAQSLWGYNEFYLVINSNDKMIEAAIKAME